MSEDWYNERKGGRKEKIGKGQAENGRGEAKKKSVTREKENNATREKYKSGKKTR